MTTADPWYRDGLRFACTRCGNCCTGAPGFTWVTEDEIAALAAALGLTDPEFRKRYTRNVWRKGSQHVTLIDKGNRAHDCVFFTKGVGCTVYDQRPRQCRTWPFWRRNLVSAEEWADVGRECPGVGRGAVRTLAEISAIAADDGLV